MITLEFNFSVIAGSFLIFLLTYINIFLFRAIKKKRQTNSELEIPLFNKNLLIFFIVTNVLVVLHFITRILNSTNSVFINAFYFEGILSLAYIFATLININLAIEKKNALKALAAIFFVIAIPLSFLWLKTNILEGFHPFMPNYLLVQLCKGLWVISGLIFCLSTFLKAKVKNDIEKEYSIAISKLFAFFFLAQAFGVIFSTSILDYFYLVETVIAIPNLFLIYILTESDFVSIEFYKKPSLYLSQRIIFRMIITLAVIIIVALEIVNYATLYIVKTELLNSKISYFKNKTVQVSDTINKHFETRKNNLVKFLNGYANSTSAYYTGISILNDFNKVPEMERLYILTPEGDPFLDITAENLNFSYKNEANPFSHYINELKNKEYAYHINQDTKKLEIAYAQRNEKNQIVNYYVAVFNPGNLYNSIKTLTFEKNGEIQIYTKGYFLLYSTFAIDSFREEAIKGKYLELYEKFPDLDIIIAVKQPLQDAFSGLQKAQYNSFFFTTITIVIFLFMAFIFLRIIERPIRILQDGAKIIGKGDFNHEIIIHEKNEFHELARAFNNMVLNIKSLQKDQLKKEQLLSITQMSVGLNHEINNPIATIMMSSQFIEMQIEEILKTEATKQKLDVLLVTANQIHEESKRIAKILKDLQNIQEPVIEDYVDGTKMMKVKFD